MNPIPPELSSKEGDPVHFTHEEWMEFRLRLSNMKHSMNNALAVFMALAELAQRNPENYEKLARSICTRTPEIVGLIQEFSEYLDTKGPPSPIR
ncbi:MAG: hypothetical protein NTZ46_04490 [Verrucomicrobia bacterium]|nr:hypothetical protein [Verrucomicrobiota bacterium]